VWIGKRAFLSGNHTFSHIRYIDMQAVNKAANQRGDDKRPFDWGRSRLLGEQVFERFCGKLNVEEAKLTLFIWDQAEEFLLLHEEKMASLLQFAFSPESPMRRAIFTSHGPLQMPNSQNACSFERVKLLGVSQQALNAAFVGPEAHLATKIWMRQPLCWKIAKFQRERGFSLHNCSSLTNLLMDVTEESIFRGHSMVEKVKKVKSELRRRTLFQLTKEYCQKKEQYSKVRFALGLVEDAMAVSKFLKLCSSQDWFGNEEPLLLTLCRNGLNSWEEGTFIFEYLLRTQFRELNSLITAVGVFSYRGGPHMWDAIYRLDEMILGGPDLVPRGDNRVQAAMDCAQRWSDRLSSFEKNTFVRAVLQRVHAMLKVPDEQERFFDKCLLFVDIIRDLTVDVQLAERVKLLRVEIWERMADYNPWCWIEPAVSSNDLVATAATKHLIELCDKTIRRDPTVHIDLNINKVDENTSPEHTAFAINSSYLVCFGSDVRAIIFENAVHCVSRRVGK
jgi:hypothetical protein